MGKFTLHSVERWSCSPKAGATAVNLSSSNQKAVVADSQNNIYLFDSRGKTLWETKCDAGIYQIDISSLGKYIGALCEDSRLRVYSGQGLPLWEEKIDNTSSCLDINQEDGYLAVGSTRAFIYMFRLDGKLIWKKKTDRPVFDIVFAPDADGIITLSTSGDIALYNYEGAEIWNISTDMTSRNIDVSRDGKFIITTAHGAGIRAYTIGGEYIGEYDVMSEVRTAKVNASGKLIYLTDEKNRLILLGHNAEVIWHKQFPRRIVNLYTNDSGTGCLVFNEGGEIEYIELAAEESLPTEFLEFSEEAPKLNPELIWIKDFEPVLEKNAGIQTLLSPGGNYIAVFSRNRLSVYRDNSLLIWNDFQRDSNPEIHSLKNENFFFLNTSKYLIKYDFRKGLEWKNLMKFDKLYSPVKKGLLFAVSNGAVFAIDRSGEIQWEKKLSSDVIGVNPSPDGAMLAVLYKDYTTDVFNNSGGLSYQMNVAAKTLDIHIFGSSLVYIRSGNEAIREKFPTGEKQVFRSVAELTSLYILNDYVVLFHRLGGITLLDNSWERVFENNSEGNFRVFLDRFGEPLFIFSKGNKLEIIDKAGRSVWEYNAGKKIKYDTICYGGGKMIFFAGVKLYYFNVHRKEGVRELVDFIEFRSKGGKE